MVSFVLTQFHYYETQQNHLKEHNAIMQENAEVEGGFWEYLEDLSSKELPE